MNRYYIQLYTISPNGEMNECISSDSYGFVDGRLSLRNKIYKAIELCNRKNKFKKGFTNAFQIRVGSQRMFSEYRALTRVIRLDEVQR